MNSGRGLVRQKNKFIVTLLMTGAAGLMLMLTLCGRQSVPQWRTAPVEKGDLNVEVTASGTVNPHSLVQVGTQVSGTISRILADFNSRVKKGQLIALLDTTFLNAAVQDASAALRKAQAQEMLTKRTTERTKELFDKGLAAQADLDQTTADYESSRAALSSAQAQLDRAKINLAYATIRSPITGVVVNRNIDVGQTVAASFNTPTLFTIADDLTKMQVQASIDEADIGQVKTGQNARFTVDAYPERSFAGTVTQVRLQPTTVQNVVSYTVIIDVDNPDLALMPGMTANITVAVQQAHDVLKVPASALKFVPPGDSGRKGTRKIKDQNGTMTRRPDSANPSRDTGKFSGRKNQTRIFILENDKPVRIPVNVVLSNGGYVAVEGNLNSGQLVIVGITNQNNKTPATQQSPLGGRTPGMPGRMH